MSPRKLAVNSTVAYLVAFLVTTILHELAHAVASLLLGGAPVIYNNHVENRVQLAVGGVIAVKLAGPIFSLVQGVALAPLAFRGRRGDVSSLLVLWLSILGLNNFLGYLFTGPFARAGDIGAALRLLEVPMAGIIAISVVGIAAQLGFIYHLRAPFLAFAFEEAQLATADARKNLMFHGLILPWFVGSFAFTLLSLPSPAWISLIYPVSSGMPFIMPWQAAGNPRAREGVAPSAGAASARIASVLIAALVLLVAVNQLVLKRGVSF